MSISTFDRQRHIGKTFINAIGVNNAKFGNKTHFLSFVAIGASTNGTGFHI